MTKAQILADMAFLNYLIGICKTKLILDTGLQKLLNSCSEALTSSVTLEGAKALVALNCLCYSLKLLWSNNIQFCTQLNAINSGDFEYGKPAKSNEDISYKDFEFELLSAAILIRNGLREVILPDHSTGNDIFYKDIGIQCKHPNVFKRDTIDKWLRKFQSSLKTQNKFGIFGLAIEDCFGAELTHFELQEEFNEKLVESRQAMEQSLKVVFDDVLQYPNRFVGLYITTTYYCYIENRFFITRDSNAILCFRHQLIGDETYKNAYRLLQCFNPSPNWLVFEKKTE
jgi:hypothetical protein